MRARRAVSLPGILVAVALVLLAVRLLPDGALGGRAVDDLAQLAAAGTASGACAWRARRVDSRRAAVPWLLLALGTGSWALGEVVWSWYELVAGRPNPFPSWADAGFLAFPLLAAGGVLLWPSAVLGAAARWRALLDGVLVVGALFVVTWSTALRAIVDADTAGAFALVVSLAYPLADLVLLTITIVFVTHRSRYAGCGLGLLTAGLVWLAVSDSAFAYLTATGRYATGSIVDAGWIGGFLFIALAAHRATERPAGNDRVAGQLESTTMALLPYAPAVLGLTVATVAEVRGDDDRVPLAAAAVVVAALLVRQLLAVLDNRQLVRQLVEAEQELRHQAFHDPLTGLANRALFANRLRHGLDLHRRDLRPLSVLYCDLDGFKAVNDSFGHDGGDEVLKAAAERLRAVTRPGDTVARMGGDEFAILLEDDCDAPAAAARILDAFSQPAIIGRCPVPLGTSIGVAGLAPEDASVDAAVLLRRADDAMYRAKRTGKGRVVLWSAPLAADASTGA